MGNPVVHFEVVGKDAAALQRFYKQAFDWKIGDPIPATGVQYAMAFPEGQSGINGGIGGGRDDYGGHVTFYVEVPDLEAALTKIQGLGGDTMMPPDQVPGGPRIALFRDPEGHVVGLVQSGTGRRP
ncbi:MAG: VOC family protein [Candidatus Eremiobacteraeota bacterium]|nr:VOC family protein [Candidatus Eremiobacteraeota bacterium]MBC5827476.1 VOC family protein [Candidatus Eremiobacteraeota bacterium]